MLLLAVSTGRGSRLCAHLCQCFEHSDLVDCRARGLVKVPHGLPHGTWLLDLGGNTLVEIRAHAFAGLWSLRVLVLADIAKMLICALPGQKLKMLVPSSILTEVINRLQLTTILLTLTDAESNFSFLKHPCGKTSPAVMEQMLLCSRRVKSLACIKQRKQLQRSRND